MDIGQTVILWYNNMEFFYPLSKMYFKSYLSITVDKGCECHSSFGYNKL